MARKPRVHLPGGYYHVMMRGNGGNDIFFSAADHSRFLLLLQAGIARYEHRVHAFCLMDNHVHLLIQVGSVPLSKIIQNLGFRYTRYINQQRNAVGHLFQGRFKAILVDADSYLLELVRYIHLNPVRAGLCEIVEGFEWSSHHAYMGEETIPWLHRQEILARFSDDESKARSLFLDFTEQGIGEGRRVEFHNGSHLGQILGDDDFAERALSASGYGGMIKPPSLHHIIEVVCNEYGIEKSALHEQGKGRLHSEARAMAAFIVQGLEGVTLTSLAEEMNRELSAISQSAGRLHQRMNQNEPLRKKAEKISAAINMPNYQA
ncbi:transposase [Mariprofundus ferrooxydans]|nr:transposase [Mariprofundus ferrooxydans]